MARKERRALELERRRREKKQLRDERALGPLELLARRRAEHAAARKSDGAALAKDGHYAWMASLLGAPSSPAATLLRPDREATSADRTSGGGRVLEIGGGCGESTRALLDRGWSVVAFDENVECLRAAHERCAGTLVLRGHPFDAASGAYAVAYDDADLPTGSERVVLVEGDLVGDERLAAALARSGPFDAVTCWLLDSHEARMRHAGVLSVGIAGPEEHRLGMQRLAYRLADKVLRRGGVLHVVDRVPRTTDALRLTEAAAQGLLRLRDAMADGTSLELVSLDVRDFLVSVRSRRRPPSV